MVRHVAYRAIQSGCCGYTYGAQGCWNAAWTRDDRATTWGDMPWDEGIDLSGAEHMGHLRRFYEDVGWSDLSPNTDIFSSESVFNTTIYAPLVTTDLEMDTIVVFFGETYRNGDGEATLSLLNNVPYTFRWFDTRTGVFTTAAERARPRHGSLPVPAKPDDRDWVLLAQASKG
jgi:Protein of unknown function (DUF4038)